MYYLKHRPKTIAEIDNAKARETVTHILTSAHLPHAFLFIGQKGTGKTSTARIFAKVINCLNKKRGVEPCNTCINCKNIDTSSSPDVTELDAASNRGIEEIKNLIRDSAFAPMSSKYRVFIIDEAHMITHEAFNALLKTLEEPPSSVIFILATTNEEKVPKTIQSRCFKVVFGKAKKEDVLRMLKRIIERENLSSAIGATAQLPILELITSHSDSSFRDAAKLLEELVIQDKLTYEEAQAYLGIRSKQNLLNLMSEKPMKDALQWIEQFTQSGGSFKNLIEELLEELRLGLLEKHGIQTDEKIITTLSSKEILYLMKLLHEAYTLLRSSPIDSLPLEIAIVEFYNKRSS